MNPVYFLVRGMQAHTPSDATAVDGSYNHGVYIDSTGDLAIEFEDGTSHTFTSLPARTTIYGRIAKVKSTGTTVTTADISTINLGI